jgi:hypothetical protein
MNTGWGTLVVTGDGTVTMYPRACTAVSNPRPESEAASMTDHCHAATAQLTREYQGDYRRGFLTPATTSVPQVLDEAFHISTG